jgi:hypothetical protein
MHMLREGPIGQAEELPQALDGHVNSDETRIYPIAQDASPPRRQVRVRVAPGRRQWTPASARVIPRLVP